MAKPACKKVAYMKCIFQHTASVRGGNGFSKFGISSSINLTTWTIMNTYYKRNFHYTE
jgi:hypothetical protein